MKYIKYCLAVSISLVIMMCVLLCTSCDRKQEPENMTTETKTTNENEATAKCEITGYTEYAGQNKDLFLSKGDKVAVISPSALPSQKQVDATVNGLKKWGYVPVEGKHVCEEERTLEDCVEDLKWALEDPEIKAVFCVRGGYGASEVMDELSLELIADSNKLIIGYSDITVYHSAWTVSGVSSVHASMSGAFTDLPEECAEAEQRMLKGEIPSYKCESSSYCKGGVAEGILTGGNLSTYTSVLETDYDSSKIDKSFIIFIEDVGEDLQHIHRYLTVLKHLGVFDRASGVIFGEWTELPVNAGDYSGDSRGGKFGSVAEMICRQILEEYDIPVAFGFPAGHGDENYPMLFGENVRLSVSEEEYTLEWIY